MDVGVAVANDETNSIVSEKIEDEVPKEKKKKEGFLATEKARVRKKQK